MFYIETANPVALKSFDHTSPSGTAHDNYSCQAFNDKLIALFEVKPISVLDIGCAGGAMVESFIKDGQIAVGVEGSDYSKTRKRASWATIPDNLFTADATHRFVIHQGDREPYQFDVITAWEFFEHIEKPDLPMVLKNILCHLKRDGLLIGTINTRPAYRHRTLETPEYWINLLRGAGLSFDLKLKAYFGEDWVRNCGGSFRIAMRRTA